MCFVGLSGLLITCDNTPQRDCPVEHFQAQRTDAPKLNVGGSLVLLRVSGLMREVTEVCTPEEKVYIGSTQRDSKGPESEERARAIMTREMGCRKGRMDNSTD